MDYTRPQLEKTLTVISDRFALLVEDPMAYKIELVPGKGDNLILRVAVPRVKQKGKRFTGRTARSVRVLLR